MFGIIIIILAVFWIVDELIKSPIYNTDEKGMFTGWEYSEYKGLFDFIKKHVFH